MFERYDRTNQGLIDISRAGSLRPVSGRLVEKNGPDPGSSSFKGRDSGVEGSLLRVRAVTL